MKHLLLKNKQWLVVLIALLGFGVGAQADEATNLTMLGKTGTKVSGQDYYIFSDVNSGEARWYPNSRTLQLDNVTITNTGIESFIHYSGTQQIYVKLIGKSTFKYSSSRQAKPAISVGGKLTIESKDNENRGKLTITTYGHLESWGQAAITVSGYSSTRATFNVSHCDLTISSASSTAYGNNRCYDYNVFTSTGSYKGNLGLYDAGVYFRSFNMPILGNAMMTLSRQDCIYDTDINLENGNLVKDDGTDVKEVRIGYPLLFGVYDSYSGTYSGKHSAITYTGKQDFGTDGVLVYDENEHTVTLNGGELKGEIVYYGRDDLIIRTKGTQLTTLEGDYVTGIQTINSSLIFEGDRVNNHQGLKLTYMSVYDGENAILVPMGKNLTFRNNAKVQIEDYDSGLTGYKREWSSWPGSEVTPTNLPSLTITNSSLDINTSVSAINGFQDIQINGCKVIPDDYQVIDYWHDATYYPEEEDDFYDLVYYYYPQAFCDNSDSPQAYKQIQIVREDNFGIKLAGRDVTLDNIYDLNFKDETGEVSGVTFNEDTYTLTLDNAYIHASDFGVSGIELQTYNNLTIMVKGECNIESDRYIGIYSHFRDVRVRGEGQFESRLKVYGDLNGVELENIHTMTLHDCSVDFMGNRGPGFTGRHDLANGILENWASLWVYDDACARLSSKQGYATENMDQLDLHLNNRIMTPVGAYFDEDLHGVALNGQLVKGEVIIGQNIYFEDSEAERVCVANWDANGDGGINIFEAEAVTSLGNAFTQNEVIENFNELKYFKGLTFIDEEAFGACTNLSQVTIPKNVTRLGRSCFAVSGLTRVVIPKSVRYFSGSDFQSCEQLSDVVFEEGSELQGLAWGSFLGCSSLEDIELPEGITVIPAYCFSDCGSLYWYSCDGPLTLIAESAFEGCSCLYVYIPDGVEYVGNSAFSGCYAESFSLPASVKYVGASAFPSCWDLYIPEDSQLEEVGDYAFSGCEYMSLTLPATLWKIGKHAFDRPDEGMGMFYDSEDPVTITVKRSKPAEVGESIFGQLPDGSEIYVPDGRANIYKSAWPEYEPYIVGGDAPTAIDAIRIGKVKDGVYTVNGQFIRRNATTEGLPSGIYVVNGKKVIVK